MSRKKGGSMPAAASPVEQALTDLRQGKMIVLVDDDAEKGEADLCLAAELTTPEAVNFMATHGRGLICLSLTEDKLRDLGVRPSYHDYHRDQRQRRPARYRHAWPHPSSAFPPRWGAGALGPVRRR